MIDKKKAESNSIAQPTVICAFDAVILKKCSEEELAFGIAPLHTKQIYRAHIAHF